VIISMDLVPVNLAGQDHSVKSIVSQDSLECSVSVHAVVMVMLLRSLDLVITSLVCVIAEEGIKESGEHQLGIVIQGSYGSWKTWKVMEFCVELWKVIENVITIKKVLVDP